MLTCLPQSLCSKNFRISGLASGPAAITFDFFASGGAISLNGVEHTVSKKGRSGGEWTVEGNGTPCAVAREVKSSTYSFEMHCDTVKLTITAQPITTRSYDIFVDGVMVGTIKPAHLFTRRAFIECANTVPELAQLFSFWLAAFTWRRDDKESFGASLAS